MKKLALSTLTLATLAMGTSAIAADMAARPIARPAAAYTNWTGCYLGGTVGAAWGRSDGYSTTGATNVGCRNGLHAYFNRAFPLTQSV